MTYQECFNHLRIIVQEIPFLQVWEYVKKSNYRIMGNKFNPFSFYENISSDILEEYHNQAFNKAKEIYGEVKNISSDSLVLDLMIGEKSKSYVIGTYKDKVAMRSEDGDTHIVCDIIK